MYTLAHRFNDTVSIELVGGAMMLVGQMQKKQVATFGGVLDEWARAAYPSPLDIARIKNTGEVAGVKTELNEVLAEAATGTPVI